MIPDFSKKLNLDQAYGPAMKVTDPAEAKEYFETLVNLAMSEGQSREEAEKIQKANLGYWSGYYDQKTMARVQRLFNCVHPIFGGVQGPSGLEKSFTAEELIALGKKAGERAKKGLPIEIVAQPKNKKKKARKILW
jgi:hypothetical protein